MYKVSSAWDSMTAESELGVGVKELRRLDPSFTLEDWKSGIQEDFLPDFMSAFLRVRHSRYLHVDGRRCMYLYVMDVSVIGCIFYLCWYS